MRGVRLLFALLVSAGVMGCQATAPVAPAPTTARLVVLLATPSHPDDIFFALYAYLVDSDDGYTNVTGSAQWSASNPSVMRFSYLTTSQTGPAHFDALGAGQVSILATYQGLAGFVTVTIPQSTGVRGSLQINSTVNRLTGIGHTAALVATDLQSRNVTSQASWASADPSIVTVSQGVVTAVSIGTTTISATLNGASDSVYVSVLPNGAR